MLDGKVVRAVDVKASTFAKSLRRIKDPRLQQEIRETIQKMLFMDLDSAPAKLHLHQLKGKPVTSRCDPKRKVNVWSLHVTSDDRYKASFTFEDGTAYFRLCDEHDIVDKNP